MAEPLEQRVQQLIDGHVISACQKGDREAFRLLFEAYKDRVFSIAIYSLGDEAAARDVTQQVFLKLLTAIAQFRGRAQFTTWLYRLVINACLDEQRRRRRFLPFGESVTSEPVSRMEVSESPEKDYARGQIAGAVQVAIGEMKPKFRLPILLKYLEGLSYEEIADVLGCSKGTVASRLNRGHKVLAKRLGHLRGQF